MTDNVKMKVEKNADNRSVLHIEVDLDVDYGMTPSGKAIFVGGTEGWLPLVERPETAVSLMLTRKPSGRAYCGGRRV